MILMILGLLLFAVSMVMWILRLTKKKKNKAGVVLIASMVLIIAGAVTMPENETVELTKEEEAELPLLDLVKVRAEQAVGTENNMEDARNIVVEGDASQVKITMHGDEVIIGSYESALLANTADVLAAVQSIQDVKKFVVVLQSNFVDEYGNEYVDDSMRTFIRADELAKINFENFNNKNIATLAENHFVHPAMQ